jgi:hypothetical protein
VCFLPALAYPVRMIHARRLYNSCTRAGNSTLPTTLMARCWKMHVAQVRETALAKRKINLVNEQEILKQAKSSKRLPVGLRQE